MDRKEQQRENFQELKEIRESKDLTQKALADEMGLDPSIISKAERGENISVSVLEAYIGYFTKQNYPISADFLLGYTDAPNNDNSINLDKIGLSHKSLEALKFLSNSDISYNKRSLETINLILEDIYKMCVKPKKDFANTLLFRLSEYIKSNDYSYYAPEVHDDDNDIVLTKMAYSGSVTIEHKPKKSLNLETPRTESHQYYKKVAISKLLRESALTDIRKQLDRLAGEPEPDEIF